MRRAVEPPGDHAAHLRELLHQVRLRVQAAGGVDDHDVAAARLRRLDRVVGDGRRVAAALGADEVRARALRPDLELLLRRGAERVGGARRGRSGRARRASRASLPIVVVLPVPLTPTTRITRRARCVTSSVGGSPKQRRDLLRERLVQVAELAARLEPPDELGRRAHADVAGDQRLLEPLPGRGRRPGRTRRPRAAR